MSYLKNGSVNDSHIFLVSTTGKNALELYKEFDSLLIVPRGNIKTSVENYLIENKNNLITLYAFLDQTDAFLFKIKY